MATSASIRVPAIHSEIRRRPEGRRGRPGIRTAGACSTAGVVGHRAMKLLFVGTSSAARGTETHLVTLAGGMARLGHEVAAVACAGGFVERALLGRGVRVAR